VCDGFHSQYVARWGGDEANPHPGAPIADPRHFIRQQNKLRYVTADDPDTGGTNAPDGGDIATTHLPIGDDGRAGTRRQRTRVE
jgi:hypothetical protein